MTMPLIESGAPGIRPIDRQQMPSGPDNIHRRDDGSSGGFRPQTNVSLRTAIRDMAATLGKIGVEERFGIQKLPQEVGDVVRNILRQSLSVEATLARGIGSTIESQRFSADQLMLFSRMLMQVGTLVEKGYSMELSDETQALLSNLKASLVAREGGEALEPVLMSKASFELLDSKTAEQLPQALYEVLSQLATAPSAAPQTQPPTSDSFQFLKQLVKFFMPRPGVDIPPTDQQPQPQSPTQRLLQSMFKNFGGQPTSTPQAQPTSTTVQPQAQPTSTTVQSQSQAQPQPTSTNVQPQSQPQSQPTSTTTVQPQSQPQGQQTVQSQGQAQPTSTTVQPQAQPQPQPTSTTNVQPQSQPQAQPQPTSTNVQPQAQPTSTTNVQSQAQPQPTSTTNVQPQPTSTTVQPQSQPTSTTTVQPQPTVTTVQPQAQQTVQSQGQQTVQSQAQQTIQPQGQQTVQSQAQQTVQPQGQQTVQPQAQPTSTTVQPQAQPTSTTVQPQSQPTSTNVQPQSQPQPQSQSQAQPQPTSTNVQPQGQQTVQPQSQPTSTTVQPQSQPQPQPTSTTVQPQSQPQPQPTSTTVQPQPQPTSTTVQPQSQPQAQSQPQVQPTSTTTVQPQAQPTSTTTVQPQAQPQSQPTSTTTVQSQAQPQAQPTATTVQPQHQPTAVNSDFVARQMEMREQMDVAKTMLLRQPIQNTPQTTDALKDLAQFLLRNSEMSPRETVMLQNFVNNTQKMMPEAEARHLQNLLRLCQQNVPLTVQQAAVQQDLPDLPRLWAFMQLCDMANLTSKMNARAFKRAGKDVADFATAMTKAMSPDNSVVQNQRTFQMMMPLYIGENERSYPTYLSVYDEKSRDADGNEKKETWLRLCVLTDHIGAAELIFRIYDKSQLDMRFYFSRRDIALEFGNLYVNQLKHSLKDMPLNIGEIRIGAVGERMASA